MPYTVKECSNHDIAGLVERVDEVIFELLKSQSSNLTDMKTFDRTRIGQYNQMLNRYASWIVAAPDVDVPETHPRAYPIKYISEGQSIEVENKAIRDLVRLYQAVIIELCNSQSARAANSLTTHDKRRFDLLMQKVENFLADYVDETQPIDMPESAPSSESVTAGLKGA